MDSDVALHLDVSARNLTVAASLTEHRSTGTDHRPFDWVTVICFYASVRSINAWILAESGSLPRSHGERFRKIRQASEFTAILHDYADLRDWSEQARYTLTPDHFRREHADAALTIATRIHQQVTGLLDSK